MKWLLAVLLTGSVLVGGCRADAVYAMARTTALADAQYATAYTGAAADCLAASETRVQYDACMAPWNTAADAVRILRDTTLALDVSDSRRALKAQACRWFQALSVLDALSPVALPAVQAGLDSKWSRKC